MTDLLLVVGARPNFMKAAPIVRAARGAGLTLTLVHTGQHYEPELSDVFFDELGLPGPDVHLGVGSGTQTGQTARIMLAFEPELCRVDPAVVVVVGDVNSTLACGLAAAKEGYAVAHVEAGLRSFDERMPEELNRRLCDQLSRYLFTTSADATENLLREGIDPDRIELVGNTMVDTLVRLGAAARARRPAEGLGVAGAAYAVATMHRPENVDEPAELRRVVESLVGVARRVRLVVALHPRTRARLAEHGLEEVLAAAPGVLLTTPLGYLDFVGLVADARLVLTDSGGVQEETTVLGVPCLTLRESTERPVTVVQGTNRVVGTEPARVLEAAVQALSSPRRPASLPELWDGQAAERIVARLRADLRPRAAAVSAGA